MEESKKNFFIKSPSWRSEAFHEFILQVDEKIRQELEPNLLLKEDEQIEKILWNVFLIEKA